MYIKDESVSSGAAYGYQIGQSKGEVFKIIKSLASEEDYKSIFVSYQEGMNSKLDIVRIGEVRQEQIERHNQWDIAIGSEKNFLNGIRFTFNKQRLSKIYRHRYPFELP